MLRINLPAVDSHKALQSLMEERRIVKLAKSRFITLLLFFASCTMYGALKSLHCCLRSNEEGKPYVHRHG